jgi:hypothetical protein
LSASLIKLRRTDESWAAVRTASPLSSDFAQYTHPANLNVSKGLFAPLKIADSRRWMLTDPRLIFS